MFRVPSAYGFQGNRCKRNARILEIWKSNSEGYLSGCYVLVFNIIVFCLSWYHLPIATT